MPVQTIETVVNDHQIKIVQFYAVRGFKIKAKLYKLVLPVLTSLIGGKDIKSAKSLLDMDISVAKAGEALSLSIEPDQLFSLLLEVLSGTFVDGQVIDQKKFDELFVADYNFAYKLAWESIKANSFFDFGDIGNLIKNQLSQVSPIK